ncbi:MAG: carboxymuconolactone decarboxylase family protein [Frateuria sp.]|nr:carboxymuconolactone decarboxylase family protein [Frateuria sp.]
MAAQPILKSLKPVDPERAQGAEKDILDKAKARAGFIPNMYANMANAPAVLDTYLHGYGLFRSESGFTPPEQEVVFLAASQSNGCTYCMAAHSMIADKVSKVPPQVLQAIRDGRPIPDARLAALFQLTSEMVRTQGRPSAATVRAFLDAGFEEKKLLYVVLALAVKTLSNFSNHALATEVDERFAAYRVEPSDAAVA